MPDHMMMPGQLVGAGNVRLHTATWRPLATPPAMILLVHGYAEHVGRYDHVVTSLLDGGYAVAAVDHRGHGKSSGRRAAIRRFDDYVDDLGLLARSTRATDPDLPVFLLGHSMGGLIAIRYALTHQDDLAGLIVTGPALVIDEGVSRAMKRVGALIARLAPDLPLLPNRPGVLSRDPEVERRFGADPCCYTGRVRTGLAHQMLLAAIDAQSRLDRLTLPVLAMHGAEDTLTSPAGSRLLHERASSVDKTLVLWPGLRHEIFHEPERDDVIVRLLDWLQTRTGRERT